jgi:hypothetical protein
VKRVNRKLEGWANYFDIGTVSEAYKALNHHATDRLRQWLCQKYKVATGKYVQFPDKVLYGEYRLTKLETGKRNLSSAKI